jgi:hypothetical protein
MIANDANGAVVVILHVHVKMWQCDEGGKKEDQNEKRSYAFVPEHGAPFTLWIRLNFADEFVKSLCQYCQSLCQYAEGYCINKFGTNC